MVKNAKDILTLNNEEAIDFFIKIQTIHDFELPECRCLIQALGFRHDSSSFRFQHRVSALGYSEAYSILSTNPNIWQ